MNVKQIREQARKASSVDANIRKILARHTEQDYKEQRRRITLRLQQAVELASANGEKSVTVNAVWCSFQHIIADILLNSFSGFDYTFDQLTTAEDTGGTKKPYTVTIEW